MPYRLPNSRLYVLLVLAGLSAFNQVDRQLMSIVLEPVRHEFALSDVQLGLLSGLAFAILFTTFGIPVAVLAATRSRRNIVAAAAAVWGVTTILCGLAQSFLQMFIARLGVGAGEAGGMAPSQAMVSDLYAADERATALGVLAAGTNAGIFIAFLAGGYVAQRHGWRMAFFAAGIPTVLLALLLRFSVSEPPRAGAGAVRATAAGRPPGLVRQTARQMWTDRVLRHLCIGATLTSIAGFASLTWLPAFLVRSHHLSLTVVGLALAVVVGIGGAIGTYLAGALSDRARRHDIRWSLWLVAAVFLASKPFVLGFYLVEDTRLALTLFVLPGMLGATFAGPTLAVLHNRLDAPLRPVGSAILLLLVNLLGLGLGPLAVGAMSEWVFAHQGEDSLRYALAVMLAAGVWGSLHYYLAGHHLAPPAAREKPVA